MITADVVGDEAVLAWLRATPNAVASSLARAISKLGIDLQRKIQQDELSGQILVARSGSLKSSIDLQIDRSGDSIATTAFSGSKYARAHEYGFADTVNVKASLRSIREAFGRSMSEKTVNMRAYRRHIDLPERSFMRSALEDMAPAIRDDVEAALLEALTR